MTDGLLLLAVAAGYGLIVLAKNEPKWVSILGYVLGGAMIIYAIGGIACSACHRMCQAKGSECGMMGDKKAHCPMMAGEKAEAPAETPAAK